MNIIQRIWLAILVFFGFRIKYKAEHVGELPDKVNRNRVYLIGDDGEAWFAAFRCPCGCGETIELSLLPDERPHWKSQSHKDSSVTLHPSVWRTKGCKSHFIMRGGLIKWC